MFFRFVNSRFAPEIKKKKTGGTFSGVGILLKKSINQLKIKKRKYGNGKRIFRESPTRGRGGGQRKIVIVLIRHSLYVMERGVGQERIVIVLVWNY